MRPFVLLTALAATAVAADFKLGNHTFTLPDGFEIEVVAASPLVDRPINISFDESGALYVTDSSGSNEKPDVQVKNPTHRVLRLVDKDGDGKFDDKTVFADKLSFPEGAMWLDGSLYVSAPPQIWKFTDGDGDGLAEKREVWFDGKTLTGCANDLHGPYAGPDGFIYWCKGAFAEQRHTLANGKQLVTKASHVFRARPDGSGLESVMTGGMDNPVDVVFTPGGERLVSGTFFIHPGGGKRDGILHAVWGGVYGKDHAVLDGHPRTGELMPIMTHMGPAAPSGMELTRSGSWGADWLGNVYCCNFNLRKVTRHVLAPDGVSFRTTDSDFVVSDHTDFHPTDVVEDADGSLLIADTGGWYKLCCPTSTLAKADVLGAIYRVKKKDAQRVEDPRGLKLDWAKADAATLATRLSDQRHEVAARAMAALAIIGEPAIAPVAAFISTPRVSANTTPLQARLNAINTLTRIPGESARAAVRFAFADKSPLVRIAVAQSASLWRDAGATEALINHLTHADAQLRRISAEALGRIGDKRAVPHLLAAAPQGADRFLEHTLATALVELGDTDAVRAGLTSKGPGAARVALIAAENLHALKAGDVIPVLQSKDESLRAVAEWLAARHADWGKEIADSLRAGLASHASRKAAAANLVRFAGSAPVQAVIADAFSGRLSPNELPLLDISDAFTEMDLKLIGSAAMKAAPLRELPASWIPVLKSALAGDDIRAETAIGVLQSFAARKPLPAEIQETLRKLIRESPNLARKTEYLPLLPTRSFEMNDTLFRALLGIITAPPGEGAVNADCIGRSKLSESQLKELAAVFEGLDSAKAAKLLAAFEPNTNAAIATQLLDTLQKSKAVSAINPETIRRAFAKCPDAIRAKVDDLITASTPNGAQQRARLDALAAELPKGDVRRGHQIFRGVKSTCTTCHAMAYVGGTLGPDLTKIGGTRTERDLLEAIVFPSASFVRSYEPVFVKTKGGEQLGILKKDAADEVILATGPGTEARIARADVVDIQPAPVSLMPPGMDGILTPAELADLVAFLRSQK